MSPRRRRAPPGPLLDILAADSAALHRRPLHRLPRERRTPRWRGDNRVMSRKGSAETSGQTNGLRHGGSASGGATLPDRAVENDGDCHADEPANTHHHDRDTGETPARRTAIPAATARGSPAAVDARLLHPGSQRLRARQGNLRPCLPFCLGRSASLVVSSGEAFTTAVTEPTAASYSNFNHHMSVWSCYVDTDVSPKRRPHPQHRRSNTAVR